MADTAAFFAKKKTKKKKFKSFNANKIDASQISTDVHVDAPEISAEEVVAAGLGGLSVASRSAAADAGGGGDQWADTAPTWGSGGGSGPAAGAAAGGRSKVAELLDMQALSEQRKGEDDVAERLRIEETKAQLARAKEGMAKEAERVAAEKEAKEFKKQGGAVAPSGGLGSGGGGGGGAGGKWVPSHMRGSGGGSSIRGPASMPSVSVRGPASMDGAGFQRPVDTACEELFPDLAEADKIVKEKEEREAKEIAANTVGSSQPARAPAGWGSRMGQPSSGGGASAAPAQRRPLNLVKPVERKPLNLSAPKEEPVAKVESPPPSAADEEPKKEEPEPEAGAEKSPEPEAPKPAAAAAAPKVEKKLKKKKKKDLSTFKAKS